MYLNFEHYYAYKTIFTTVAALLLFGTSLYKHMLWYLQLVRLFYLLPFKKVFSIWTNIKNIFYLYTLNCLYSKSLSLSSLSYLSMFKFKNGKYFDGKTNYIHKV